MFLIAKQVSKASYFAFQIARHLAFIVNETKLMYTMSLFLPYVVIISIISAKCHITIAHLENEIQKHHNTTINVPALQIIVVGSSDVKSDVYCMLCICW